MNCIHNETQLVAAVADVTAKEPRFKAVVDQHGLPPLRRSQPGLRSLLRIVTDQLISLRAAEAIWTRLQAELEPFDAVSIAAMPETGLKALGLSGAKARTFRAVSHAVTMGQVRFDSLENTLDGDVLANLTAIKGIGPWTADIYLLSAMGRADAWPAGDLALQAAAQSLFDLTERPQATVMTRLAETWRPWRSVAARLLWSHYRGLRGMTQRVT